MGLIWKKDINSECKLGIWEITEDYDNLLSRLSLSQTDMDTLSAFRNRARQVEWLSVRVLLNELTSGNHTITYNYNRKPFIKNHTSNISISHSKDLTSIFLSPHKKVGLDLEFMSHRISRIEHKFINKNEVITDNPEMRKFHLYIHWCAKEALYKICDKQDINFKDNLTIEPFEPREKGVLRGWVNNKFFHEMFNLEYFTYNNYIIVWTCK